MLKEIKLSITKKYYYNYKDAYILVRSDITIIRRNLATQIAFKKCATFVMCVTKIDGTTINDAEELDLVVSMNNYSDLTLRPRNTYIYVFQAFFDFRNFQAPSCVFWKLGVSSLNATLKFE